MMINERSERAAMKELRVQLPVDHLIRLHSLKILKGKDIRETVEEALAMYFAHLEAIRNGKASASATATASASPSTPLPLVSS